MGLTLHLPPRPDADVPERGAPGGRTGPPDVTGPSDRRAEVTAAVLAVGLVAWAVAVDPWGVRPFTTLRWPVLATTVLVAAAIGWRARPPLPATLRALGLALVGWLALAAAVGVDPLSAWLGHPQRHLGIAGWVVLVLAFRVGTVLDRPRPRRTLGRGAIAALLVLGTSAAVELLGWSVAPAATDAFGARVGGLLGQPAYLGAAGVVLVPVALGAALRERGAWRGAGFAAVAFGVVAVVASQTRGAWLGLLVAAVVGGPAMARRLGPRRAAALVAGAVVALGVLALATPLGDRAASAFDVEGGSGRGRLDEWRVAAAVIAEHPVVGVGPEGYRIAVTEHLDEGYARRYGRSVYVDRAHDGVLDVAAAGGLPAAALYVAITGLVLIAALGVRRHEDLVVVGAAAAVAGTVVQQLVLFPIAEVDPLAWLLAGVVVAAAARARTDATRDRSRRWTTRLVAAAALVAAATVVVLGALDVGADRHLAAAGRDQARGDHLGALGEADAATRLRPDSIDTWWVAADVAAAGESLVDLDAALDRLDAGLARSPRDPALADRRAQLLVERAQRSELPADLDAAQGAIEARLAVDPANPAHHRRLGLLLIARGDPTGSVAPLERALELDPDDGVAAAALEQVRGTDP